LWQGVLWDMDLGETHAAAETEAEQLGGEVILLSWWSAEKRPDAVVTCGVKITERGETKSPPGPPQPPLSICVRALAGLRRALQGSTGLASVHLQMQVRGYPCRRLTLSAKQLSNICEWT